MQTTVFRSLTEDENRLEYQSPYPVVFEKTNASQAQPVEPIVVIVPIAEDPKMQQLLHLAKEFFVITAAPVRGHDIRRRPFD